MEPWSQLERKETRQHKDTQINYIHVCGPCVLQGNRIYLKNTLQDSFNWNKMLGG